MNAPIAWQRLPWVALIFFFLSSLRLTVKHAYNALPAFVAIFVGLRSLLQYWPYALMAGLVILLLATLLRYRRFTFALEPERIRVRQGVFSRTELNLDYERIQQADIIKPIWFKPFELAILQLQSAGSKGAEVAVAGLPIAQAEQLQQAILRSVQASKNEPATATVADTQAVDFSLSLPNSEILRIGLLQNTLIVAGVLLALLFSNQVVGNYIIDSVESFIAGFAFLWQALTLLIVIALAAVAVLMLGAVLFYFNQYYQYQLHRSGDRVAYTAGLLSKLSRSFRMPKLQLVEFRQGVVARLLRRSQMRVLQAGGITDKAEGRFTVPVLDKPRRQLISDDFQLPRANWQRVSKWLVLSWLLSPWWWLAGVAVGAMVNWWFMPVMLVLLLLLRWQYWRVFAWHFDGAWLALRVGIFGRNERFAPAAKMQRASLVSGPLQRRLGFTNLSVYTAGGTLTLAWLPQAQAYALYSELLTITAGNNKRWM